MSSQIVMRRAPETSILRPTRPQAYGYMRVPCNIPDDKVRRMERELRRGAERKGFHLVRIFNELDCGQFEALEELLDELRQASAHYVIVPTLRHFAKSTIHQDLILDRLMFEARAEVFELVETFL